MKYIFSIGNLRKGGAERVVVTLSNELCIKNDVTIVLTTNEKIEYNLDKRINIVYLDNKLYSNFVIRNIIRLKRLKKVIDEITPDVIITFIPEPSLRMAFVNNKKYPLIVSVRNDPKVEYSNVFRRTIMKHLFKKVDGFVFQTEEAQNYFKFLNNSSVIIPNPVNSKFLNKPFAKKRRKTIVNVGRLTTQKNQELLINAFNDINKKYSDYRLIIYGEGPLKNNLMKQCNSLKLNDKVDFKGEVSNLEDIIYNDGIFVLTSNYEGMPNSLMEAMALGLPCISSNCPCGGPNYLIKDGFNGLLFDVNDKNALIDKIEKCINDKDYSDFLGKNAKMDSNNYSINRIVILWEQFVESIINSKKKDK